MSVINFVLKTTKHSFKLNYIIAQLPQCINLILCPLQVCISGTSLPSRFAQRAPVHTINPTGYNQICLWGSFVQGRWKSRIYVGRGGLSMILWYKKALGLRSGFVGQQQSRVGEGAVRSERDLQCF